MNRKDKIDFLTRLSKGLARLEEILPANYLIKISAKPAGTIFYINEKQVDQAEFYNKSMKIIGPDKIKFKVTSNQTILK